MSGLSRLLPRFKSRKAVNQSGRDLAALPNLAFAIKAEQVPNAQHGICAVPRRDTVISRLAYFFFCLIRRLLLGRIANDYFTIKMPGGVAENR